MGYYEDIGRTAGEAAREEIERKGITDPAGKWNVHKEHLGGAVAKAAVLSVVTTVAVPLAVPALLGWGVYKLAKKVFK